MLPIDARSGEELLLTLAFCSPLGTRPVYFLPAGIRSPVRSQSGSSTKGSERLINGAIEAFVFFFFLFWTTYNYLVRLSKSKMELA